jgi:hypothetical protein
VAPEHVIPKGIELSLKAYSPSDPSRMEATAGMLRISRARRRYLLPRDLLNRRFSSSFLRLVPNNTDNSQQGEILPVVPIITVLTMDPFYYFKEIRSLRNIWPASVSLIASKLPRLHRMELSLQDTEKKDLALRKMARDGEDNSFIRPVVINRLEPLQIYESCQLSGVPRFFKELHFATIVS